MGGAGNILEELNRVARRVEQGFKLERRVLSFQEYLKLFSADPIRQCRDAARYVRDMFDYFGTREVERPWGPMTRYEVFDLPWLEELGEQQDALVGQEYVQGELYRAISNFVREGAPKRVLLTHGPNGSAKSTLAACVMRGLEHYSRLDEGALYRFHWVFPNQGKLRGSIGFSQKGGIGSSKDGSYAHLVDDELDARLYVEVRDHPLFLLPTEERAVLLKRIFGELDESTPPSKWLLHGSLSHKNRQVYEALLGSHSGSLEEVLRYVQVVRYFISRRDRVGAVTLGPQLSVDAAERQITADRSLAALPPSLQSVPLFEAQGELVDAAGGVLEFSDLLKRPLDAFKYLQITAETGEVALGSQSIQTNCVLVASANEIHLAAFREHPEFESFRGRLKLIQCAYLKSWRDELAIYDAQVKPQITRHVAPHATALPAMFAVLTRMRRPNPDRYPEEVRELLSELTAEEKLDLYADGSPPRRLEDDSQKTLRSLVGELYSEGRAQPDYEGRSGASPREMRTVLLDAAQSSVYAGLSPFAVLDELGRLCERTSEFAWLNQETQPGGYHDHEHFRRLLRARLFEWLEDEFRVASGLVEEIKYGELFGRYITNVTHWLKGERLLNPLTQQLEDPDQRMMQEVEALLGNTEEERIFREALIGRVAAWAIDNPGRFVEHELIFRTELQRMREKVFSERRGAVAKLTRDILMLVRDEGVGLDLDRRSAAQATLDRLISQFGYDEDSVADAAGALVREPFTDLLD